MVKVPLDVLTSIYGSLKCTLIQFLLKRVCHVYDEVIKKKTFEMFYSILHLKLSSKLKF